MKILVDGIVSVRDKQPYLRLFADDKQVAQLSMSEARKIAMDNQPEPEAPKQ